jgi:hypothetical protein
VGGIGHVGNLLQDARIIQAAPHHSGRSSIKPRRVPTAAPDSATSAVWALYVSLDRARLGWSERTFW